SSVVDGQNGLGALCYPTEDLLGINVQRVGSNVREHRPRPLIQNAVCRTSECKRSSDRFVPRLQSCRERSPVERCGTGTEAHRILGSDIRGKGLLELADLWAGGQPIRP